MSDKNIDELGILDPDGKHPNPLTGEKYKERYFELSKIWSKFPAYENARQIINDIKSHSVTLVISGTGSGKTVLVPKYVLHALNYEGKIAITLPKKIISRSAAEFAAETLDVELGNQVGYQYRGSPKSAKSANTKLLYATDGTIVSRLLTDPKLTDFDAVIIDEAHERKVNIDFLLYLLRETVRVRPEFKVVIMSATIDKTIFEKYFAEFKFKTIEIGGKTNYPIKSVFAKETPNPDKKEYLANGVEKIVEIVDNISKQSKSKESDPNVVGILFFVTSVSETLDICDLLNSKLQNRSDVINNTCISVFSGMDQELEKMATDSEYFVQQIGLKESDKYIKLIVSTNVAESSLTIEGIQYVVDSGLELRSRFDNNVLIGSGDSQTENPLRVGILEKVFIARAQAKQRMGRTGRTGPGTCYHLYTEQDFNQMDDYPLPAIRSDSISGEILRLMNIDSIETIRVLKKVLTEFIEPPNSNAVQKDLEYLQRLEMITTAEHNGTLTNYGKASVDLQLEPEQTKAVLAGYSLYVYHEVSAIIHMMGRISNSISKLFSLPKVDEEDKGKKKWLKKKHAESKDDFLNLYGDWISLLRVFAEYQELRTKDSEEEGTPNLDDWTYRKFLNREVLEAVYKDYKRYKGRHIKTLQTIQREMPELVPKASAELLEEQTIYKVLACMQHGYRFNTIKLKDGYSTAKGIEVDKDSFVKSHSKVKKALYADLFQFGKGSIKAKIVTYESVKANEIITTLYEGEKSDMSN